MSLADFRAAAADRPNDPKAHLRIAEALKQLGRPIEAAASYQVVASLYAGQSRGRNAMAALELARRLLEGGLPDGAESYATVTLELAYRHVEQGFVVDAFSDVEDALYRLTAVGQQSVALDIATAIANLAAQDARWMRLRAEALRLGGLVAEAAGLYSELVAEITDDGQESLLPHVVAGLLASAPSVADLKWATRSLIQRGTLAAVRAARRLADAAVQLEPADKEALNLAQTAHDLAENGVLLAFAGAKAG